MRYIINIATFFLTTFGGFHLYLNILSNEQTTYEGSIHLVRQEFTKNPIGFLFACFLILAFGLLITRTINWVERKIIKRGETEENEIRTQTELLRKRNSIRGEIRSKVYKSKPDGNNIFPFDRIKGEFGELNIRDIKDPDPNNYFKYETFDFREDGIELVDGRNIMYKMLVIQNSEGKWDAIHKGEKPRRGSYNRIENVICVDFIPYENVEHIDWSLSPYNSNITINCLYKYRKYDRHPFKQIRYYIKTDHGYWKLDNEDRINLKRFNLKEYLGLR